MLDSNVFMGVRFGASRSREPDQETAEIPKARRSSKYNRREAIARNPTEPVARTRNIQGSKLIWTARARGAIKNQPTPAASSRSNQIWLLHMLRVCSAQKPRGPSVNPLVTDHARKSTASAAGIIHAERWIALPRNTTINMNTASPAPAMMGIASKSFMSWSLSLKNVAVATFIADVAPATRTL